jgi:hypothetical protein
MAQGVNAWCEPAKARKYNSVKLERARFLKDIVVSPFVRKEDFPRWETFTFAGKFTARFYASQPLREIYTMGNRMANLSPLSR